jgi:hypothetical protein
MDINSLKAEELKLQQTRERQNASEMLDNNGKAFESGMVDMVETTTALPAEAFQTGGLESQSGMVPVQSEQLPQDIEASMQTLSDSVASKGEAAQATGFTESEDRLNELSIGYAVEFFEARSNDGKIDLTEYESLRAAYRDKLGAIQNVQQESGVAVYEDKFAFEKDMQFAVENYGLEVADDVAAKQDEAINRLVPEGEYETFSASQSAKAEFADAFGLAIGSEGKIDLDEFNSLEDKFMLKEYARKDEIEVRGGAFEPTNMDKFVADYANALGLEVSDILEPEVLEIVTAADREPPEVPPTYGVGNAAEVMPDQTINQVMEQGEITAGEETDEVAATDEVAGTDEAEATGETEELDPTALASDDAIAKAVEDGILDAGLAEEFAGTLTNQNLIDLGAEPALTNPDEIPEEFQAGVDEFIESDLINEFLGRDGVTEAEGIDAVTETDEVTTTDEVAGTDEAETDELNTAAVLTPEEQAAKAKEDYTVAFNDFLDDFSASTEEDGLLSGIEYGRLKEKYEQQVELQNESLAFEGQNAAAQSFDRFLEKAYTRGDLEISDDVLAAMEDSVDAMSADEIAVEDEFVNTKLAFYDAVANLGGEVNADNIGDLVKMYTEKEEAKKAMHTSLGADYTAYGLDELLALEGVEITDDVMAIINDAQKPADNVIDAAVADASGVAQMSDSIATETVTSEFSSEVQKAVDDGVLSEEVARSMGGSISAEALAQLYNEPLLNGIFEVPDQFQAGTDDFMNSEEIQKYLGRAS